MTKVKEQSVATLSDELATTVVHKLNEGDLEEMLMDNIHELITTVIEEELSECDEDLMMDLAMCVVQRIRVAAHTI